MPLIADIKKEANFCIKVWKIEEEIDFFTQNASFSLEEQTEFKNIKHKKRQKEWLASRFVLKQINNRLFIEKDEYGNPHAKGAKGDISISHCTAFAAAGFSSANRIGIDIEPIHEKIHRIKHKFLNEEELLEIDADNETEHLIAHWCIKEAAYKWYGKKSLAFKENILISPFQVKNQQASVKLIGKKSVYHLDIVFRKIENCIFAYTVH
ncbi:MAG: 4'-phosphopantetheinyl transferase family protein [Chitinophagales bacterium]